MKHHPLFNDPNTSKEKTETYKRQLALSLRDRFSTDTRITRSNDESVYGGRMSQKLAWKPPKNNHYTDMINTQAMQAVIDGYDSDSNAPAHNPESIATSTAPRASKGDEVPWWRRLQKHAKVRDLNHDLEHPAGFSNTLRGHLYRRRPSQIDYYVADEPPVEESLFGPSPVIQKINSAQAAQNSHDSSSVFASTAERSITSRPTSQRSQTQRPQHPPSASLSRPLTSSAPSSAAALLSHTHVLPLTAEQRACVPQTWQRHPHARVWRRPRSFEQTEMATVGDLSRLALSATAGEGGASADLDGESGSLWSAANNSTCTNTSSKKVPIVSTTSGVVVPTEKVTWVDNGSVRQDRVIAGTDTVVPVHISSQTVLLPLSCTTRMNTTTLPVQTSSNGQSNGYSTSTRLPREANTNIDKEPWRDGNTSDLKKLLAETGYSRREMYTLWIRYRVLCALSGGSQGMSCDMLQYGVPRLSVEDDVFLARVCHLVDQDRSGIIEWDEFLQTVTALEWGSLQVQCRFLIQCYDLDGDGAVGRADLTSIFRHSSMLFSDQEMKRRRLRQELLALAHGFFRPSDQQMLKNYRHEVEDFVAQAVLAQSPEEAAANATADDVVAAFVTQTFKQLGKEGDDATISYTDLVEYVQNHGGDVDVWKLFGRSVVPV